MVADTVARAAVAKPGTMVCRELQVGIAEREWVRGVVLEADGTRVAIRIEDPGRFEHAVNGTALKRAAVLRDDTANWTPCL